MKGKLEADGEIIECWDLMDMSIFLLNLFLSNLIIELFFSFFAAMISEGDTLKKQFTHRALKIWEFTYKTTTDKRKLLAEQLGIALDEPFPDSLGEVRIMSPTDSWKNKNAVPVIPNFYRKIKLDVEPSEAVTLKIAKSTEGMCVEQS